MKLLILVVFFCFVFLLFFYRFAFASYQRGGICFHSPVCVHIDTNTCCKDTKTVRNEAEGGAVVNERCERG